jgi:hypothetical protein
MSLDTHHHDNAAPNGGFERQDLRAPAIVYFLVGLAVATALIAFVLKGLYYYLDTRERISQPTMSPLITNVPTDTRHIPATYPQSSFPNPKLEEDERNQLNQIRLTEEQTLNSYGWVDEKAGTVRIPIERAMELIAQRGLPVRPQSTGSEAPNAQTKIKKGNKQ